MHNPFTSLIFLIITIFSFACSEQQNETAPAPDSSLEGDFWKYQAIDNIIIPWTREGMNAADSLFPAFMDRQWQPSREDHIFPGMLARHVFSYSTAYLLSGEDRYLNLADHLVRFLIQHGWDAEAGLWFNELDGSGKPVDKDKDLFMQLYAVTGLAMHYVVTRDAGTLDYVQRSIDLLNQHAWDNQNGGYYNVLNRDLSVADSTKKATPQLAPLSGYLAYLYPATRNENYLSNMERGVNVILERMMDSQNDWLLESFSESWRINKEPSSRVDVGHNIEIVWMLLRLHLLTGKQEYKTKALDLYPRLFEVAFNLETGAWYHKFNRSNPEEKPATTPWWIQVYGNMLEMYLYRITGDQKHLDRFQKGAAFWNEHFIDREYGGAFLSAGIDGSLHNGNKAVRSKTSYHSMEHGLLNYLYLKLWVQEQPATLYFKIRQSEEEETFYSSMVEDPAVQINKVMIDGKPWKAYDAERGAITLPALKSGTVQVELVKAE